MEKSFASALDGNRVNEEIATRANNDKPFVAGVSAGPEHAGDKLGRTERGDGLLFRERQWTNSVERNTAGRGRIFHGQLPNAGFKLVPIETRSANAMAPSSG